MNNSFNHGNVLQHYKHKGTGAVKRLEKSMKGGEGPGLSRPVKSQAPGPGLSSQVVGMLVPFLPLFPPFVLTSQHLAKWRPYSTTSATTGLIDLEQSLLHCAPSCNKDMLQAKILAA